VTYCIINYHPMDSVEDKIAELKCISILINVFHVLKLASCFGMTKLDSKAHRKALLSLYDAYYTVLIWNNNKCLLCQT
jgi:hypothetical protein